MSNKPKCAMPGCYNFARKNKKGKYLLHCSRLCQNKHNSMKGKEKRKQTCLHRYGETTNLKTSENKEQVKKTLQEKYGVEHPCQNALIKKKVLNTKKEKYGNESFNNREKFKSTMEAKTKEELNAIVESRKKTNLKKYGYESAFLNTEVKNKIKKTNIERYGFENAAKSNIVKNKIKQTMEKKYGGHFNQRHIQQETLKRLNDRNWLIKEHHNLKKPLTQIGIENGVDDTTIQKYMKMYNVPILHFYQSNPEKMLCEYLHKSFQTVILQNVRTIIPPREIDIWIPAFRLGIEYNGRYWHRPEKFGSKKQWFNYHQSKIDLCNEKGINLLHLWEGYGNHEDLIDQAINGYINNNLEQIFIEIYENKG